MTGCAAPCHDGQDEPTPVRPNGQLCMSCERRLPADLHRLPRLHAELSFAAQATGGDGNGLPFSEPAAECRDQIEHDLTYWTLQVIKARKPPRLPRWEDYPVLVMATWLYPQAGWCSLRDWAPDMAGAISADRSRAVALLDPWVTKRFDLPDQDGVCLDCGKGRMQVTVYVYAADHRKSFIGCTECAARWEFGGAWLPFVRQVLRRRSLQETA